MRIVRLAPALVGAALLISGTAHAQAAATTKTTTRNYDCSKAGNANKAACKTAAAKPTVPAATAPAPAQAPAAAPATRTTAARTATTTKATTTNAAGPNGATAQCRDGTYSKSAHRSGTCAGHKGVATWY